MYSNHKIMKPKHIYERHSASDLKHNESEEMKEQYLTTTHQNEGD